MSFTEDVFSLTGYVFSFVSMFVMYEIIFLKRSGWQMVKPLPTMKLLTSICSTTFYLYSITNIVSELCRVNGKSKDALVLSIHRT